MLLSLVFRVESSFRTIDGKNIAGWRLWAALREARLAEALLLDWSTGHALHSALPSKESISTRAWATMVAPSLTEFVAAEL